MGIISSREILQQSREHSASKRYSGRKIQIVPASDRLVRDELREEVQYFIYNKQSKAYHSIPVIQVTPKGLQQEDV